MTNSMAGGECFMILMIFKSNASCEELREISNTGPASDPMPRLSSPTRALRHGILWSSCRYTKAMHTSRPRWDSNPACMLRIFSLVLWVGCLYAEFSGITGLAYDSSLRVWTYLCQSLSISVSNKLCQKSHSTYFSDRNFALIPRTVPSPYVVSSQSKK